jgi:hypothetical protein
MYIHYDIVKIICRVDVKVLISDVNPGGAVLNLYLNNPDVVVLSPVPLGSGFHNELVVDGGPDVGFILLVVVYDVIGYALQLDLDNLFKITVIHCSKC